MSFDSSEKHLCRFAMRVFGRRWGDDPCDHSLFVGVPEKFCSQADPKKGAPRPSVFLIIGSLLVFDRGEIREVEMEIGASILNPTCWIRAILEPIFTGSYP